MKLSVLIITARRPAEFERCYRSVCERFQDLDLEVLALFNGSAETGCPDYQRIKSTMLPHTTVIEWKTPRSYIQARNCLGFYATGDAVLLIDDDALVLDAEGARMGLDILENDPEVGAIAYPQCTEDGGVPEGFGQSSDLPYACDCCSFGGYAAMIRSSSFRAMGGFREIIVGYGEELEFCRRMWSRGERVIWLPTASFAHLPSEGGRDRSRQCFLTLRNTLYNSLLTEPFPLPQLRSLIFPRTAKRFTSYYKSVGYDSENWDLKRRASSDLSRDREEIRHQRRVMPWKTVLKWQASKKWPVKYATRPTPIQKVFIQKPAA